ncbi:MAG: methionyl-tRNA formyltransferase [Planctomycetota bacterium]
MRLIVMGTGPFAVPSLRALAASDHEVATVVCKPPRGRRSEPPAPMASAAESLGLPLWRPETVNSAEAQNQLAEFAADLMVVCDYGEILKDATLQTTRLGGVNLHGSLLPRHRGAAPVQWAILKGDTETGASVIQMTPGLDAGPILGVVTVAIDPDETAGELEDRLAPLGAELVLRVVNELASGTASSAPQDESLVTKAPRLDKSCAKINWTRPADWIKNHVRGLNPWPRAFTLVPRTKGDPLRLAVDRVQIAAGGGEPGTVLAAEERLVVACGEGAVELLIVQPAGKRAMPAADWLRGAKLAVGDVLGAEAPSR